MKVDAKRLNAGLRRSRVVLYSLALPLLAFSMAGATQSALRLVYIVLGFSLIIFLHELGHFIVARLCSVKCLAFSIGIGPRLCGWRKGGKLTFGNDPYDTDKVSSVARAADLVAPGGAADAHSPPHAASVGDCDYRVSWLPLGGYVRMLGQDDMDPTKVSADPHAFNNRPIWQRMCIISAGVVMNVIFAAVTFSIIFHPAIGVEFPPAFIGQVAHDSPAWKAGLRAGDEVLFINEPPRRGFLEFADIQMATALSTGRDPVKFEVRHRDGRVETLLITPQPSEDNGLLAIGVLPMPGSKIGGAGSDYVNPKQDKINAGSSLYTRNRTELLKIQDADRIVAVDGIPIDGDYMNLYNRLQAVNGQPVKLTLKHKNGTVAADPVTIYPRLEPLPGVRQYPGVLGLEPLTILGEPFKGSEAAKQGLKENDCILAIGARSHPTVGEVIAIISQSPGIPVDITVARAGESQPLVKHLTPKNEDGKGRIGAPVSQDMEHLSFIPPPKESELGALNLPPGAVIAAVDGKEVSSWQDVYGVLRAKSPDTQVDVLFKSGSRELPAKLTYSKGDGEAVANLVHYVIGLSLENQTRTQKARNPAEAVMMGMDHTKKFIVQVYMTLAGLARRTVPAENLHGIVGIAKVGYDVQERGIVWLWYVLAMVSVNLAVANFLPLPIVDGGHFLLLILEKVRGKPLSIKVQSAIQVVGIVLLLGLFLFVTRNDIMMFTK